MNLIDVAKTFGTQESCNDFLEELRWPDGPRCVNCDSDKVSKYVKAEGSRTRKNPKTGAVETKRVPARILYVCRACKRQFSVTEGTIFNDTHLSLEKWFMAVALMVNAKKGLSALQLQRDLKTAYKTSWYLAHRIRKAMGLMEESDDSQFTGTVEADATYIGGKFDKRRKRAKYDKQPVFGLLQRGKGDEHSKVYIEPVSIENKAETSAIIEEHICTTAKIYTDEGAAYRGLRKDGRKHEIVVHGKKEWVRGDIHTNGVEGFWSLLKRGIIGSFHQVSVKHLHRYIAEFQFRFNNREAEDIFVMVIIALVIGRALPYAKLIAEAEAENTPVETGDEPF